jgi:hypothetical protein
VDFASILIILILVLACPIGLAWAQSRWEIWQERRSAAQEATATKETPSVEVHTSASDSAE